MGSQLTTVIRIEDLVTQFRKGLQALKQKEKENGDYNIIGIVNNRLLMKFMLQ